MLAYSALQLVDAAQYADPSQVLALDFMEMVKKAAKWFFISIGVIFLLGILLGFWMGNKWGRSRATSAFEDAQERHADAA